MRSLLHASNARRASRKCGIVLYDLVVPEPSLCPNFRVIAIRVRTCSADAGRSSRRGTSSEPEIIADHLKFAKASGAARHRRLVTGPMAYLALVWHLGRPVPADHDVPVVAINEFPIGNLSPRVIVADDVFEEADGEELGRLRSSMRKSQPLFSILPHMGENP